MHGVYAKSTMAKWAWTILHSLAIFTVGWLLLGSGLAHLPAWLQADAASGNHLRRWLLFCCSLVLFIRMIITGFVFLRRKFGWDEAVVVAIWLWIIHLTFALLGGKESSPVGWVDGVALALFLLGSYLNTASEWQRHRFKKRPEHQGRLFTDGWFRYSMHINYFGDLVWATGFALLTHSPWAFLIPLIMLLGFQFYQIPILDRYLSQRYGEEFEVYAATTNKLFPSFKR
ncbi:MAG: DUF1295 domain-containing protein [Firmicutes bacterium]|nr:DUF1295 domain-containing protein [Bacillota bacterium]